ncbi:Cyclin PHO80-like protein [Beauveria brongniartii RCEF 3172]|uniref:Cyclin PHO80-like protein n=1 Tax=Beauveria brongniartii RCEF 3172 TaxID=1081107 RepID=A0A167GJG4_9HYPO|nr:Cyclin PHO80-like protein [Beauveria brongniartii RCEF 3172]
MEASPHDAASSSLPTDTSAASSASLHELPPPPIPSSDPILAVDAAATASGTVAVGRHRNSPATSETTPPPPQDLFKLPAVEALRLLSASVELLVRMTGDIPPTPPPRMPTDPQMSGLQAEKENIVRSHSDKNLNNLARLRPPPPSSSSSSTPPVTGKRPCDEAHAGGKTKLQAYSAAISARLASQAGAASDAAAASTAEIDGVTLKPPAAAASLLSSSSSPAPYIIVGSDSQPVNVQHGAITRKFYSKNEPPISIHHYLQRLHQFCPMSAAVYLAASLYIHRLAVDERAIPVTRRNAHRLVLAGLRVAMKALEDLSYPHGKFARVGGVSETELARLEISFCFLAGFELVVREETLRAHWTALREGKAAQALQGIEVKTLRLDRKPREVTT